MGDEVYYHDYLELDRVLDSQHPRSWAGDSPAHDELLFIIVHQAYELWFKQILHELDAVMTVFGGDVVRERQMGGVVARLERVVAIQRLLIEQLEVLETMTPLDFLEFRDLLIPASGFQSVQFRLIENRMGLNPNRRPLINDAPYTSRFTTEHHGLIEESEMGPSLFDLVEGWLERTPFLEMGDFAFWEAYRAAVRRMLEREEQVIESNPSLTPEGRAEQLMRLRANREAFDSVFDDGRYEQMRKAGARRLSRKAFTAALLINLYRDEPILQLPFRLLTALIDIDEGFTAWRQRHALMVSRMIGTRIGTGGTSGATYLEDTARSARVWDDLIAMPTFLIKRSELPELPAEVVEAMRFSLDTA